MTLSTASRNPIKDNKAGVQTAYTEQGVSTLVRAKKSAGKSLRVIAAEYGNPITHMDIERILRGKLPHDPAKRSALKLPPVCTNCGQHIKREKHIPSWVRQAADFLAEREDPHQKERIYARGGKPILT